MSIPLEAVEEHADLPIAVDSEAPVATLKSRVVSGAGWSFLDNAAQQVLSLVIFVVLGRLLSPALFGVVSTALVFVLLMRSTVLTSVSTALVTLSSPVDEDYDTGFWLCVIIAGIAFVILNLAADPLARLYHIDEFSGVIRATSVIVLLFGLSYAHVGWARRNFRFRSLAMRNTISTAVAGLIGITVAVMGFGLTALVLNQVISALLGLLLLWRAIPWRPKLRFSWSRAKALLATAVPLGANQSLQFIAQNFDTALITYLLGPLSGGLYAAAKRVVGAIHIALWQPMASVALPAFAEVSGDAVRFGNAAVRVGRLVMALTAPLFAGIALTAPVAIVVLFGSKWLDAAPIMTVLAAFGLFVPSLGILNQMVMALGKAKVILLFTLLQMALSLAAIMLVGGRDPVRVALCLSAPTPIIFVLTLAMLTRLTAFPLGRYLMAIGRPLACTLVMAVAVLAVPDLHAGPLVQLIVLAGVGGAVYVAAALLIAREAVDDIWGFARSLLPRGLKNKRGLS
ncbi:lipopolysaccharide biosynthesis protein [Sphingomonas qilianensis]|uniref:Lipopolysaccharide biosynthesis protein n=1 Tax=Sphingomonas qilianensis TaxID=1736690 RepID=A0ABU9XP29_9SPHN